MMRHIADWGERVPPILHACPDIIRNSKDLLGLLIEEQVVITKVRLLHLSMEILRLQTETPCVATRADAVDIKK
jgi:hypothetical protein